MRPGLRFAAAAVTALSAAACDDGVPTRPSPPVVPLPVTFVLTGHVTEPVGVPVVGAKVAVLAGVGAGNSALTTDSGAYGLPGVKGTITVEFSAEGYGALRREVNVENHQTLLDVEMAPLVRAASVAGAWRATFEAVDCAVLPAALRTRIYQARITQHGAALVIEYSGASLRGETQFPGVVRRTRVTAAHGSWEWGGWDGGGIVEELNPDSFLHIAGDLTATAGASAITGTLEGTFVAGEQSCFATHRVTFRRR